MSSIDRLRQKFYEAILALVGDGELDNRLTFAGNCILQITDGEMPDEFKGRLKHIQRKLTRTPLSSQRGYPQRQLTDDEARETASDIVALFVDAMGGL